MPEPSAWRIDKARWAKTSFDGHGAAREGGRWNSPGTRVIYCSQHLAMAAQEKYLHLPKPVPVAMAFVKFRIDFGAVKVETLKAAPPGWQEFPPPPATQEIGDEWIASLRTAVLAVPSTIIPEETNFLLNPAHPDFVKIVLGSPVPFYFEPRIARLREPPGAK